jgi:hypothetical protein
MVVFHSHRHEMRMYLTQTCRSMFQCDVPRVNCRVYGVAEYVEAQVMCWDAHVVRNIIANSRQSHTPDRIQREMCFVSCLAGL